MSITKFKAGTRQIGGTDFPLFSTVQKTGTGCRPWIATIGICNGLARCEYKCPTKLEASELAESYSFGEYEYEDAVDRLCRSTYSEPRCKKCR